MVETVPTWVKPPSIACRGRSFPLGAYEMRQSKAMGTLGKVASAASALARPTRHRRRADGDAARPAGPVYTRPVEHACGDHRQKSRFPLACRHMCRHHHSARPLDADRLGRPRRVRARAYRHPHPRRPRAPRRTGKASAESPSSPRTSSTRRSSVATGANPSARLPAATMSMRARFHGSRPDDEARRSWQAAKSYFFLRGWCLCSGTGDGTGRLSCSVVVGLRL
jgi:hypothetical protein